MTKYFNITLSHMILNIENVYQAPSSSFEIFSLNTLEVGTVYIYTVNISIFVSALIAVKLMAVFEFITRILIFII